MTACRRDDGAGQRHHLVFSATGHQQNDRPKRCQHLSAPRPQPRGVSQRHTASDPSSVYTTDRAGCLHLRPTPPPGPYYPICLDEHHNLARLMQYLSRPNNTCFSALIHYVPPLTLSQVITNVLHDSRRSLTAHEPHPWLQGASRFPGPLRIFNIDGRAGTHPSIDNDATSAPAQSGDASQHGGPPLPDER